MRGPGWNATTALALCALVAGCADDPASLGDAQDPLDDVGPIVVPWGITDCRYVAFDVAVDPAKLQPYLPDGFSPILGDAVPGPVRVPVDRAFMGFEAFVCREGAGLNGSVANLFYGSYWTYVDPPDALERDGIEGYYVKWDTLVPDADRRAVLLNAGVPAMAGTADVTLTPLAGDTVRVEASLQLEGAGGFQFAGVAIDAYESDAFPFMEFAPATNGLAEWRAVAQPYAGIGGQGIVTFEPGSWPTDVVGADRAEAGFGASWSWTFANGTLTLPAPRASGGP